MNSVVKALNLYLKDTIVKKVIVLLFTVLTGVSSQQFLNYESVPVRYYKAAHFTMPAVQLPSIPDRVVYITDYGAIADGSTLNTAAINTAIQECAQKGGGKVVIPPGVWLTASIILKSNINLHLEQGALVIFSSNIDDYPLIRRPKSTNYSRMPLIYGNQLKNVAITGKGIFNGNGQYWRPVKREKLTASQWKQFISSGGAVSADGKIWYPSQEALNAPFYLKEMRSKKKKLDSLDFAGAREFLRPDLLVLTDSYNILIDGPSFVNSPKFTIHPIQCADIVIRNTIVYNEWWSQNADAIDLSSCRNVVVYNNIINAGDDGICVKPGVPNPKTKDLPACENYIIADCIVYHAHGGFVVGSESYGGARNIYVHNLTCIWTDVGLRFKSARGRGGLVENIVIDGVQMKDIEREAILFDMNYSGDTTVDVSDKSRVPHFSSITMSRVVCDGAAQAVRIEGLEDSPVLSVKIEQSHFITEKGLSFENAQNISLINCTVEAKKDPLITIKNVQELNAETLVAVKPNKHFLKIIGDRVTGIVVSQKEVEKFVFGIHAESENIKKQVILK